jgi:hypothetical protein
LERGKPEERVFVYQFEKRVERGLHLSLGENNATVISSCVTSI